jgi:hypothetical protein
MSAGPPSLVRRPPAPPTHFSGDGSVFNPFTDDRGEIELADPFTLRGIRRRPGSTAGVPNHVRQTATSRTCAHLSDPARCAYDPNRFYDEVLGAASQDGTAVVEDLFRGTDDIIVDCSTPPMIEIPLDSDVIELLMLPMPYVAEPRPPVQAGRFRIQRLRIT